MKTRQLAIRQNNLGCLQVMKAELRTYSSTRSGSRCTIPPLSREAKNTPLTENNSNSEQRYVQKQRIIRTLMHIQTMPQELRFQNARYQQIQYEELELGYQLVESPTLYKGYRNINHFEKITVITFNLLFGQWGNTFFQKQELHHRNAKLINRIKMDSILVLVLNKGQKLNSLKNIENFDQIIQLHQVDPHEPLSYQKLQNHLFYSFKPLKIVRKYIVFDQVSEGLLVKDNLVNKLLLVDGSIEVLHIFLESMQLNLPRLFNSLQLINRNQLVETDSKIDLSNIINECADSFQKIHQQEEFLMPKQKIKNKIFDEYVPEKRAEQDEMIEHIKQMSYYSKIPNMYFTIGDTVMRNIQLFQEWKSNSYNSKQSIDALKRIQEFQPNTTTIPKYKYNYAVYYLI